MIYHGMFHASCARRGSKIIFLSEFEVMCRDCAKTPEKSAEMTAKTEIAYEKLLKEKEEQVNDKMEIFTIKDQLIKELYEKISLLNEKIRILTSKSEVNKPAVNAKIMLSNAVSGNKAIEPENVNAQGKSTGRERQRKGGKT